MSSPPRPSSPAWRRWALATAVVVGGSMLIGLVKRRFRLQQLAREAVQLPANTRYTQVRLTPSHPHEAYVDTTRRIKNELPADEPWYVYVGAANNHEGVPWCGDCRRANPIVDSSFSRAVESQPDLLMVSVFVDRESYKDTLLLHPLRTDADLRLTAVPTLFKFVNGSCVDKLVENDCTSEVLVDQFLRRQHLP